MARRSKEQARAELESLIKTYLLLSALVGNYKDEDHVEMKNAKELVNGTANQLIEQYRIKNGDQVLEEFASTFAS